MRISDWSSDVCSSDLRPWRRCAAATGIAQDLRGLPPMPKCWLSLLPSRGSPRRPWVATLHENERRQNGVDGGQNRTGGEDVGQVPFPGQLQAAVDGGARQQLGGALSRE